MQRYFIDEVHNEQLIINDKTIVHHVTKVMRNHVGEQIAIVSNGQTGIYELTQMNADELYVKQQNLLTESNELAINVDIALGFLKKDNFELSLQKVVELGINQVIPTLFTRNVVKVTDNKWDKKKKRYQDIMENAAQQSRRNIIPQVNDFQTLKQIDYQKYDLVLVCYEQEQEQTLLDLQEQIKDSQNILYLIGPEGGISDEELIFLKTLPNLEVISLGKRILRAETAAIITMANLAMIIEE